MKAQACAARTYAVRRILSGEDPSTGAHITDDGDKYQICLTDVQAREIYGESYSAAISAAQSAAESTCGEVITYHGSPISAPFHLSSGEYTLSAESAWGKAFPYLVPAKNPEAAVFCSEKHSPLQSFGQGYLPIFPLRESLNTLLSPTLTARKPSRRQAFAA